MVRRSCMGAASSTCTPKPAAYAETVCVNQTDANSDVYCPTWAGGVGESSTQPAPGGRFPTFGGSGATTGSLLVQHGLDQPADRSWGDGIVNHGRPLATLRRETDCDPLRMGSRRLLRPGGTQPPSRASPASPTVRSWVAAVCPPIRSPPRSRGGKCECVAPQDCSA